MISIGRWIKTQSQPEFDTLICSQMISDFRNHIYIIYDSSKKRLGLAKDGLISNSKEKATNGSFSLIATIPPLYPEWLGDRLFKEIHNIRFPYVGGAMARGISSAELVIRLAQLGMLGFFGSAGLPLEKVELQIHKINQSLKPDNMSWGANLIYLPFNPVFEENTVNLFIKYKVRRVSASAFMKLTPPVVHYSCKDLYRNSEGKVCRKNYLFAKISRPEVAQHFLSPAPESILSVLVDAGKLTKEEAELAREVPVSEDIIVEADSGGHTDNRPLPSLFPVIVHQRDEIHKQFHYPRPIRIGAAGGLGSPAGIASAFAMGASFVLVGSVHQASIESGLSFDAKNMLTQAEISDVSMTPSADMFELGVKVQVLSRGTMMAVNGNQLYQLYNRYQSIEEIPAALKMKLEKNIFKMTFEEVWSHTREFFNDISPQDILKAENNSKHKMALIFRWYLGNSSKWPIEGKIERRVDYQIWCSPAMGAFNRWVKGSFLNKPEERSIQQIALNLLEGAAQIIKAHQIRTYGFPVSHEAFDYRPKYLEI
ncbi:MAG: PfaD family polyunsaturated fatty acid/polyketide biosynthesis protein [bacterium]